MQQTQLEKVSHVFAIFHDGGIVEWNGDKKDLRLKIDCLYLAELVNPTFIYFSVHLFNIETLAFEPWTTDETQSKDYIVEWNRIFQTELEINSSEVDRQVVKIHCIKNHDPEFAGGILYVRCENIKVFDDGGHEMSVDQLRTICNQYWDNFGR